MKNKNKILSLSVLGLLCSLALIISFVESSFIVLPVPSATLGLSNIVVMYTFYLFNLPYALVVVVIKSLFTLLVRGFNPFLISMISGIISTVFMYGFWRFFKNTFSFVSVAVTGSITHGFVQLVVGSFLMSTSLLSMGYFLFVIWILTGCLTGITINLILKYTEGIETFFHKGGLKT